MSNNVLPLPLPISNDAMQSILAEMLSMQMSTISAENSTQVLLLALEDFVGTFVDISNYIAPMVEVESDVDGLLVIEYSQNGSDVSKSISYGTVGDPFIEILPKHGRYFRVVYFNGAEDQTYFRLQTTLSAKGAQPLTNDDLRDSDVNTADSGEREYTHVTATVTNLGDTVVYTPSPGKRLRLRWIYAINNPTALNTPLIRVLLGNEEKYRVYALSKRQMVTGPVDGALTINLSTAGAVALTALIEEV